MRSDGSILLIKSFFVRRISKCKFNEHPPRSSDRPPLTSYHVSLSLYVSSSILDNSHAEGSLKGKLYWLPYGEPPESYRMEELTYKDKDISDVTRLAVSIMVDFTGFPRALPNLITTQAPPSKVVPYCSGRPSLSSPSPSQSSPTTV